MCTGSLMEEWETNGLRYSTIRKRGEGGGCERERERERGGGGAGRGRVEGVVKAHPVHLLHWSSLVGSYDRRSGSLCWPRGASGTRAGGSE